MHAIRVRACVRASMWLRLLCVHGRVCDRACVCVYVRAYVRQSIFYMQY